MSDWMYLRATVDLAFAPGHPKAERLAKTLIREGKGAFGVGERLARELMDEIVDGHIELDDIKNVEDHSA